MNSEIGQCRNGTDERVFRSVPTAMKQRDMFVVYIVLSEANSTQRGTERCLMKSVGGILFQVMKAQIMIIIMT